MPIERFLLTDKIAIVTGAGRGMGRGMALEFADAGADVVVMARTAEQVQAVAGEVESRGRKALVVVGDISNRDDIQRCVDETMAKFGRIDILVNNAGVSPIYKRVEKTTEEEWDFIHDVNVRGTFMFCKAVGKIMIDQKRGKIINVASVGAVTAFVKIAAYCTSKAAVAMLTRCLAIEWAQYNIQVNALAPGWVATDFVAGLRANPALYQSLCAQSPFNRFADPDEIIGAALYLASEASNYTTGSVLLADGGISTW